MTKRISKTARLEAENAELRTKIATLEATIQRLVMAPPPVQYVPAPPWPNPQPAPPVIWPTGPIQPWPYGTTICGPNALPGPEAFAINAGCAGVPPTGTTIWVGTTGHPTTGCAPSFALNSLS